MRIFHDQQLIQSMLDGGIHRHLICQWLRASGLPQLADSPIRERERGIYELERFPHVAFQLQRATPAVQPALLAVWVGDTSWSPSAHEAVREAVCGAVYGAVREVALSASA
ncbi:hypothetical protein F8S13_05250 [Chloroflexia bacterium SDU3-3]|nr:hypothetical protein F8S13_05250 [Chloroflexia bacterium SDU3-3]